MIKKMLLVLTLFFSTVSSQNLYQHGRLQVTSNGHYLQFGDGTPFFWLGDTGWEMFLRLSREDAEWYLSRRKEQSYNVIQAVVISEIEGVKMPNYYSDLPFVNANPDLPAITPGSSMDDSLAYDYWDHIDYVINFAEKIEMYIALLPAWGEYVIPREGKQIFNTTQQAYNYGWFMGNRYKGKKNIIWMLGGDRHPDERKEGIEIWRAMAEGIADGTNGIKKLDGKADYSTTLMTHHSFFSSSKWFHSDDWIDFHSWGSYHSDYYISRSYEQAISDWNLLHPKPTLNGEPAYEMHTVNWIEGNGYFMPYDIRDIAYWSVFSGACGHTYGNHCVWQFYDEIRKPVTFANHNWKKAVNAQGAEQMKYLKLLMESRPFIDAMPDNSLISGKNTSGAEHIQVLKGKSFAFIYIPTGNVPPVKLGKISGKQIKAWWFNPRTGESTNIGEFENSGEKIFTVPGMSKELDWLRSGRGCDWVIVLDDASKNFREPGK